MLSCFAHVKSKRQFTCGKLALASSAREAYPVRYLVTAPMHYPEPQNPKPDPYPRSPLWFLISTYGLLGLAICLLLLSLGTSVYSAGLSLAALVAVFLALGCAAFLHVRTVLLEREMHRQTANAYYATDREYHSIFEHALDGILILDDAAVCLHANPAALALLAVPRAGLVGHSFAEFHADRNDFAQQWELFLERSYRRGEARLVRVDQLPVYVSYTAAAHYLPGRHVVILCDTTERIRAQNSLQASEELFRQMADNIGEIFWTMEADTKKVIYVNPAYEAITGCSLASLRENPTSYAELIHPADRVHVLANLEEATHSGQLNEEFRIVRPDGTERWVWVRAFPVGRPIRRLVGTVLDITARKLADAQVAQHLAESEKSRRQADGARAEAEALRKATLALTQNLRMDAVLDTLLSCLSETVPYDSASVLLTESGSRLFVAREAPAAPSDRPLLTLDAAENVFIERVLRERKNVFLPDTREEPGWSEIKGLARIRCWLGVPLVTADSVLGLLSIGSTKPRTFAPEHLHLTKALAVPAAVAIHNARLYEWAEIYAAERQELLDQRTGSQAKMYRS
jgi:PAS domain S-box-containing protein